MPAGKAEAKDLGEYLGDELTTLPRKCSAHKAAREIVRLHTNSAGATFNMYFGDLTGRRLFAVSIFVTRSKIAKGVLLDQKDVEHFIESNYDLLSDPRISVGTWLDENTGSTYLDIVVSIDDETLAIRLGQEYNQKGIFDLHKGVEIPIGGKGTFVTGKQEPERLPPLKRGRRRE